MKRDISNGIKNVYAGSNLKSYGYSFQRGNLAVIFNHKFKKTSNFRITKKRGILSDDCFKNFTAEPKANEKSLGTSS